MGSFGFGPEFDATGEEENLPPAAGGELLGGGEGVRGEEVGLTGFGEGSACERTGVRIKNVCVNRERRGRSPSG